ncbi:LuxR C-terminal-related transcriptional regulator [Streptomyces solisilvae]|uniref:helix-turn-helix domain-containing protein n=1 Tax=Streptomyces malaysiensis TaxID=92644 RepID=UPI0036CF4D80
MRVQVMTDDLLLSHGIASVLGEMSMVESTHISATQDTKDADVLVLFPNKDGDLPILREVGKRTKVLTILDRRQFNRDDERRFQSCADVILYLDEITVNSLESALRQLYPHSSNRKTYTPSLTPREKETLSHVAQGLTNRQIAHRMLITEHGVKRNVAMAMAKLGGANRASAVALAIQHGIIDPQGNSVQE